MSTTHLHRILVVLHIEEGESTRPARLVVVDNLHFINGTVVFKDFSQVTLLRVQTESKYSEAPASLRILLEENTVALARRCTTKQQIHDTDTTTCIYSLLCIDTLSPSSNKTVTKALVLRPY